MLYFQWSLLLMCERPVYQVCIIHYTTYMLQHKHIQTQLYHATRMHSVVYTMVHCLLQASVKLASAGISCRHLSVRHKSVIY